MCKIDISLNQNRSCGRKHHTINDVSYTIRSQVVGCGHLLQALVVSTDRHTLGILDHLQRLAFNGSNSLVRFQISGQNLHGDNVKHQNVCKLALILRLQQAVQSTLRQSTECIIGRSKDGEWSRGTQGFHQISSNDCCNKCTQIINRLGQLDNVRLVIAKFCRREHDSVNDVRHTVAGQVVSTNNLPQVLQIWANMDTTAALDDVQVLALHGGHALEELQISGEHLLREHMIGQNVYKLRLVLGLQQTVQAH